MLVIVLENAPPRLRGRLAVWFLEIRAGVYVGHCSSRQRDRLWEQICKNLDAGNALMVWPEANEQGYGFRTAGENRRVPTDFDGIQLVAFQGEVKQTDHEWGDEVPF